MIASVHKFVLLTVTFALVGCSAKYQVNNLSGTDSVQLDRQKSVFITIPEDGVYETKKYTGSGQTVAQSVAAAFSKRAPRVSIADTKMTVEEALGAARKLEAAYVVVPVIAHWEHRATEWSGRPSVMTIRLTILDSATGNQVTSSSIEGRSRIVSWTTTSPQSLLKDPLAQYVGQLYSVN